MQVDLTHEGAVTVLKPVGPIVAVELEELEVQLQKLFSDWTKRVVLNLSEVNFLDSKALELLNRYRDAFGDRGLRIILSGPNNITQKAMELTGVSRKFEILPDVVSAVRSFM